MNDFARLARANKDEYAESDDGIICRWLVYQLAADGERCCGTRLEIPRYKPELLTTAPGKAEGIISKSLECISFACSLFKALA